MAPLDMKFTFLHLWQDTSKKSAKCMALGTFSKVVQKRSYYYAKGAILLKEKRSALEEDLLRTDSLFHVS